LGHARIVAKQRSYRGVCEKRGMMRSVTTVENRKASHGSLILRFFAVAAAACISVLVLAGCGGQPGETKAEVGRRHDRIVRLNGEMMRSDIDKVLLLDRPSRLSDKRLP
jgi:hypothetical protein